MMETTTPKRKRDDDDDNNDIDDPNSNENQSPISMSIFNRVYSSIFKRRRMQTTPTSTSESGKKATSNSHFQTPSSDGTRSSSSRHNGGEGEATGLTPMSSSTFQSPTNITNGTSNANTTVSEVAGNTVSMEKDGMITMTTAPFQIGTGHTNNNSNSQTPSAARKKILTPLLRKRDHLLSATTGSRGRGGKVTLPSSSNAAKTPTLRRLRQQQTPYQRNIYNSKAASIAIASSASNTNTASETAPDATPTPATPNVKFQTSSHNPHSRKNSTRHLIHLHFGKRNII